MEGVKIVNQAMNVRPLSSPVIELSQNTGLLLDNTLIHIPDSDTPPPADTSNANQVPSKQVPPTQCHPTPPPLIPINQMRNNDAINQMRNNDAINQMRNNDGAFHLQDSMMPFDRSAAERSLPEKSRMPLVDTQQKGAKKMKREIHATTATGTLPLRKINKRDATELDYKNAPKAPRSAYQIYLLHRKTEISIEQGKPIKITNEIVRQIGTEWSGLPKKSSLKASFENKAEEDKQRYLKELAHFLKTEPYLDFLKGKTDGGPVDTIDQYIDREQDTLNCLICNQMFSTSHNKKEHLLGRGHLLKLMNGFDQFKTDRRESAGMDLTSSENASTNQTSDTNALISTTTSYSPTFRDNFHTDSSNATTEDYWNSPNRSTMTPDASNNHQTLPINSSKPQTTISSSQPPESSPAVNHTRDALLGAIDPSTEQVEAQPSNFQNSGFLFDMDPETDKNEFDMTKLDLPDDFNITHDYLNELQSCKLEQISPSLECPTTQVEHSAGNYDVYQSDGFKFERQDGFKFERQGSMESFTSSVAEQFTPLQSSIPKQTDNEISLTCVNPSQQFSTDLPCSDDATEWSSDLTNFIRQQKLRDADLSSQKTNNATLLQTNASLKAELERLSQTKGKMEKDNANLGEYGLSLQMQIQNLRNLPIMISQSRNAGQVSVNGGGYAKSPQSGDSIHGDATSSPSTYGEGSITSPMTHHGNGLMSPLTPTMISNGMTYNHSVYQSYNANSVHEPVQSHHPMFGVTTAMQRGPNIGAMMPSQLHFPASNLLSGQWSAN